MTFIRELFAINTDAKGREVLSSLNDMLEYCNSHPHMIFCGMVSLLLTDWGKDSEWVQYVKKQPERAKFGICNERNAVKILREISHHGLLL